MSTYEAGCVVCLHKSGPLDYRSAVDWTVKHGETCEDASTEIWPS